MIDPAPLVEPVATVLSLVGASLVSQRGNGPRFAGFLLWILSNLLWIAFALAQGHAFMLVMFTAYLATSVLGAYNSRS